MRVGSPVKPVFRLVVNFRPYTVILLDVKFRFVVLLVLFLMPYNFYICVLVKFDSVFHFGDRILVLTVSVTVYD